MQKVIYSKPKNASNNLIFNIFTTVRCFIEQQTFASDR